MRCSIRQEHPGRDLELHALRVDHGDRIVLTPTSFLELPELDLERLQTAWKEAVFAPTRSTG